MPNVVDTRTKAELLTEIERLNQVIAQQQERITTQEALARGSGGAGWLITTPNGAYSGRVNGIQFENGRAFVPATHPHAQRIINTLTGDFGYQAQVVKE